LYRHRTGEEGLELNANRDSRPGSRIFADIEKSINFLQEKVH